MKIGFRKPSLSKRIAARTSVKRMIRAKVRAPKGLGLLTNPKKAIYNRVYRRTSLGCVTLPVLFLLMTLAIAACGATPTPTRAQSPATATSVPVRWAPTIALSTSTPILPTATRPPATATAVASTPSPIPATSTAVAPTATRAAATSTSIPPTVTRPAATPVPTAIPPTATRAPSACPQGCAVATPPAGCDIKGNISSDGRKLYHVRGGSSYAATKIDPSKGEKWFCTEAEARAAGWERAQQ
jgi:hypothetical protein